MRAAPRSGTSCSWSAATSRWTARATRSSCSICAGSAGCAGSRRRRTWPTRTARLPGMESASSISLRASSGRNAGRPCATPSPTTPWRIAGIACRRFRSPAMPRRCSSGAGGCTWSAGRPKTVGRRQRITGAWRCRTAWPARTGGAGSGRFRWPGCIAEAASSTTGSMSSADSRATSGRSPAIPIAGARPARGRPICPAPSGWTSPPGRGSASRTCRSPPRIATSRPSPLTGGCCCSGGRSTSTPSSST